MTWSARLHSNDRRVLHSRVTSFLPGISDAALVLRSCGRLTVSMASRVQWAGLLDKVALHLNGAIIDEGPNIILCYNILQMDHIWEAHVLSHATLGSLASVETI